MKVCNWLVIPMMIAILILTVGVGFSQASPKIEGSWSVQVSAQWFIDIIDQPGDLRTHPSIAIDPGNGTPWISYYDADNTALMVTHYRGNGGNCGPVNDWYCETVDNAASVGTYSSIDVYPNTGPYPLNTRRVGVAYYDATYGALKFAEYSCFPACAWNIVTIQDADYLGAPSYGQYASMKYDADGDPLIAYYVSSSMLFDDGLIFAYQVTNEGNCGIGSASGLWECETVDSGDHLGQYTSLDFTDFANMFIAYYDGGAGDLKYAYYTGLGGNCGTGNTWTCITVDGTDGSDVGKFVSLHVQANSNDKLRLAYYDATNGMLKYAAYVEGGNGNCGGGAFQCDNIDNIGTGLSQAGISLAVDRDNHPMIAYMDDSEPLETPDLKVAQKAVTLVLPMGNCGPLMGIFYFWQCTVIDNGSPHQEEAEDASIAITNSGLAMVAYSEHVATVGFDIYNLKVAYQRAMSFLPIVRK